MPKDSSCGMPSSFFLKSFWKMCGGRTLFGKKFSPRTCDSPLLYRFKDLILR